jgi:hypothetical protein
MPRRQSEAGPTSRDRGPGNGAAGEPGHSGRLLLRMPPSLHGELARAADADGVSLNQFITSALASAVGWRGAESAPSGERPARRRGGRNVLLAVNLIVLVVLAVLAVVVLVTAWHQP